MPRAIRRRSRTAMVWPMRPHSDRAGALDTWLERTFGVSALRFLTAGQAGKASQGLFAMKKRSADAARNERESA